MSRYTIKDNTNCLNTTNSITVQNNLTIADDRFQLLTWLSPLDPGLRHWDIQERRVKDVGEWLIGTEEFRRWCGLSGEGKSDKAVLFCYGNPGVGKTFISSLVVDTLYDQTWGHSAGVTCFYFDFAARKEQSATNVLGSLLKQMVSGTGKIAEEIRQTLREQKEAPGGRRPQLVHIVKMLQLITSSQPTYICIDALDECTVVERLRLFDSLKEILERSPCARVFVTARPHIRDEIEKRLAGRVTSVSVGPTRDDIVGYLRARLSEDETPDAMDEVLEAEILENIPENISQMFLLVALNIDAILQEPTIYRRRERLSEITSGLGLRDAYGATIERIRSLGGGKSRLGMEALMWISHAERPLRANELCHALAVELGSKEFNVENVPSMPTLISCCQGLITVDKEALTVRLIHFTLREYLSARDDIFTRAHSAMAEICLTYLNSKQVQALSAALPSYVRNTPFLEYCSLYWGVHAKRELSDYSKLLALELLHNYGGHISAKTLLSQARYPGYGMLGTSSHFSGLHCASFFGIVDVVAALIDMDSYDINERDRLGRTPLACAAENGHVGVVNILLLQAGVNPDKPDIRSDTPLLRASSRGHEEVVKRLLAREEVNVNNPDRYGCTPLSLAAQGGYEGVVKALLERDEVNPDQPNNYRDTPLSCAAQGGHEAVVKTLLERREVNPDKPAKWGRTPLMAAAEGGHGEVVKILLRRADVNPNMQDYYGITPLMITADNGHVDVVRILLAKEEVNLEILDNDGDTALSCAAFSGRAGVVKILLEQEGVNPDRPNNTGRTPLSYAAWQGYEKVVKILLKREEVNPNRPDNHGQTPLMYAAERGHQKVIGLL